MVIYKCVIHNKEVIMNEFILKNRDYLLLFLGSVVSNLGTHIYNFAISLYILDITNGNAALAGIYFAFGGIVYFILTPFGGAIVDRLDKVKVVWITDIIRGVAILLAAYIIFSGVGTDYIIYTLFVVTFILGVNGALFGPAASSLPAYILEEDQLQQHSSINQMMFALYSILGVIAGGIIYSFIPIVIIFIANGASFILSGISEMFIRTRANAYDEEQEITFKGTVVDIKEGMSYLVKFKPILNLVLIAMLLNFFTAPVVTNGLPYLFNIQLDYLPIFFAFVMAAYPVGVIVSSIRLATQPTPERVSPQINKGLLWMSVFFTLTSVSIYLHIEGYLTFAPFMIATCLIVVLMGAANAYVNVPFNTAILKVVDKDKLGRINSSLSLISNGLTPIAIALGGFAVQYIGVMNLFFVAIIAMFLTTFLAKTNREFNTI